MGRNRYGYLFFFWLAAGVGISTAAANRLFLSGIINYQALYEAVSQGWQEAVPGWGAGSVRTLAIRLLETAVLAFLCRGRVWQLGTAAFLFVAGLSAGTAPAVFTWCRGVFGLICFWGAGFPHMLCYGAVWGLFLTRAAWGGGVRRSRFWGLAAALFLAGVLGELWINPLFLACL